MQQAVGYDEEDTALNAARRRITVCIIFWFVEFAYDIILYFH